MNHPKFGSFTRIKSAAHGKPFRDWTKEERGTLAPISGPILDNSHFFLRYLPADDAYFIKAQSGRLRTA
jgi:hypothetical protein